MIDFKILIVDHDDEMRNMLTEALKENFNAVIVSSGAEVLAKIPEYKPQLVIIDFRIDDMSSVELQQEIAKKYPDIHAVMMSSVDRSKISLESMKKRAMDYIYRSDDAERFLSDICKLIRWLLDMKYNVPMRNELMASGFYGLAQKLYEEKKWTVEEIQKILEGTERK